MTAQFEGIHFGLSATHVHVLQNAASRFDANIQVYGGDPDPAFHPVHGTHPTAAYSGQVDLNVNGIITFAGYGKNKTNYGDTTGLFAHVVLILRK